LGSFRESGERLKRFELALYAASVDRPETNLKFATRLELPYPILSDPDKGVARDYGVLKLGMFARRWTFVIDPDGLVAHIEKNVSPKTAGNDLVELLETLGIAQRNG